MGSDKIGPEAFEAVGEVIARALRLPEGKRLQEDDRIGTVEGWDSLGHLNILVSLEKRFGKRVAQVSELGKATSVGEIAALLRSHGIV